MEKLVLNYSRLSAEDRDAMELHRVLKRNRVFILVATIVLLSFLGFLIILCAMM
jgi:hypothetical protein